MNIGGKDGIVAVGGREFKRVKNGLEEAQITSFIDELIKERDDLAQSQHHMQSLTKLAETTIVEADRLARQIKTEASEQAKAESAAILDKAREQAEQMAEMRQAEIMEEANEKARAIQSQAEKKSALLLESERDKIRDELRNFVNQQFGHLLEKLEDLKRQAAESQADFANNLSQAGEDKAPEIMEIVDEKSVETAEIVDEKTAETTETAGEKSDEATAVAEERDAAGMKEGKVAGKSVELVGNGDQTETNFDLAALLQGEDRAELGEPQWEVAILPPVEITKVMEVMTHLDELREVANTEMIVPQIDTPSILVFLRQEVNFVDMLRTIPAVAYAEEVTTEEDATNNNKPRKARIGLSGNTTPQEEK